MLRNPPSWLAPFLAACIFFLTGLALLPWPGLQNDELFFAGPLFAPDAAFYSLNWGGHKLPLMVMSYSGALKTWLYAGLFALFPPNVWSIRIPVLLLGVVTIWLTWAWVCRISDRRAAAVTVALLATDTIFLMTDIFDWGPVALQHVLLTGGLLALQVWLRRATYPFLALAFFLWGLGMWDKALLAWPLLGMAVATLCIYPRELLRRLRPLSVAIALAAFLFGAAPLVWYNLARPGETARQNAKFTLQGLGGKASALGQTVDGSTLNGYMVYEDSAPRKRAPRSLAEELPVALSRLTGNHRVNRMLPAWVLGTILMLLLWKTPVRRTLLFLLVTVTVAWAQMAFTRNTGGASHHVILLWPLPAVFLGIAFTAAAKYLPRYGAAALVTLVVFLAGENLLTTNQYLARFIVNGASGGWTDAIFGLAGTVDDKSATWIGLVDWGYLNGLRTLHEGDLRLFLADPASPVFPRQVSAPDFLFIRHTDDKQIFPGVNQRLRQAAAALGYGERVERTVYDGNGRPVFELFRFRSIVPR